MASWAIHLKLAKKLNEKLKLDKDLFTFGNLIPDVDYDSIYSRREAHYYTGIKVLECPCELQIDIDSFKSDYLNYLNNPMIIGYYCHLLTDKFYNEYIYINKWIQDSNNNVIGINCSDGSIIDVSSNFKDTLKYKHGDLEKYGRFIYNFDELYVPSDIDKINENAKYLKENFYSINNIENRINYLNNGEFKEFNKLSDDDINSKNKYLLFSKEELDKLLDDCFNYIINELKKDGVINE